LAFLAYAAVMFVSQRRLVFAGSARESPRANASPPAAGVRQVWLRPSFGRVEAWYLQAEGDASGPTVIFAHGNGELIEDWYGEMKSLRDRGVDVLMVEFPGYGFSEGRPSRERIRETFGCAYDWLVEDMDVDAGRIVAYGRSLGGGAAGDLALDRTVGALVLQSTFASTASLAHAVLLPGFLVRDRFDNERAVGSFAGPVLLMHGPTDEVIPYAHAERLAGAREGLEVVDLDCAHNDCALEWPHIEANVVRFLGDHGLLTDSHASGAAGADE
jgi:hypothetical protein